ncbi:MAG: hypothetical protein GXO79_03745 [Chlorobi bacterium]|nr:hypothetical protein [Chlorobiota bacterium]
MIQEIITLAIVYSAILYTIYQAILFFIPSQKKTNSCNGMCSGCNVSIMNKENISVYKNAINNNIKVIEHSTLKS